MSDNNATKGHFVWYEYLANDQKAAIDFYTAVFGWKTEAFPEGGDYVMWVGDQGPLGGVMTLPAEAARMGARPGWMGHVFVDDVDATASAARQLGGKVHKAPEDIPTVGRFAVLGDPQGAFLSIFKSNTSMKMHDPSREKEFCWRELMTSDVEPAFKFYSELFRWTIAQDMDMGPMGIYRVFGLGKNQMGGMMKVPPGASFPPMWLYYTEVSDIEAGIARSTQNGGKLMNGPMDVPGGGRIAQLTDPQGGAFALHQSPKK